MTKWFRDPIAFEARHALALGPLLAVIAIGGCAAHRSSVSEPGFLLAVRYDVQPVIVELGPSTGRSMVQRDFEAAAGMGFDTVVAFFLDPVDAGIVAAAARSARLEVVWTQQDMMRLGRMASPLASRPKWAALLEQARQETIDRYGGLGLFVPDGGEDAQGALTQGDVHAEGLQLFTEFADAPVGRRRGLAVVNLADCEADESRFLESWLLQYHRAMSVGNTWGLLVDRFRRLPGEGFAITATTGPEAVSPRAGLKALLNRARRWGPLLCGATAAPLAPETVLPPDVKGTSLIRGPRRIVLLFNSSVGRYARGEARLSGPIAGRPVERLVEVPASDERPAGEVLHAADGVVVVPIDLRPGDGLLYEVF